MKIPARFLIALGIFVLVVGLGWVVFIQASRTPAEQAADLAEESASRADTTATVAAQPSPPSSPAGPPVPGLPQAVVAAPPPGQPPLPEARYLANDPHLSGSPLAKLILSSREMDRVDLPPDASGRPGRARLLHNESFKYPYLRVEERFGETAPGRFDPVPDFTLASADHVMVQFDERLGEAEIAARLSAMGATLLRTTQRPGLVLARLPAPTLQAVPEAVNRFSAGKEVRFAEPDYIVAHLDGVIPNDPRYGELYGLPKIEAPLAWEISTGRSTVVVGIIDSGVDYNHPDLAARIFYNPGETANGEDTDGNGYRDDIRGWDFYENDSTPMDENKHGTHVAGTVGAIGNNNLGVTGVNWQTTIMPLRFLNAGGAGSTSDAIDAVYYATAMEADLTANSWGGGDFSRALYDAIAHAGAAGKSFVAAAGNSAGTEPIYPARYGHGGLPDSFPALTNVISVGATDSTDTLAKFSEQGALIAAPGVNILSTVPGNGYESLSGTSMACPHVAGAAALVLSVVPDLQPADLRNWLVNSGDTIPGLATTVVSGRRLNVRKALVDNLNQPIVIQSGFTFTDSGGPRAGNAILEPGEAAALNVSLRAVGPFPAENVQATLTTTSPHISITQNSASYGDFAAWQSKPGPTNFSFTVAPNTPTPHQAVFTLSITTAANRVFEETFSITVYTTSDATGTVRTFEGAPFAGATIHYSGPFSGSVTTAADGTYSLEMVDGSYTIHAEAAGHIPSPRRIVNAPPGRTGLDFVLGHAAIASNLPEISASVRPGSRVTIPVVVSNSGNFDLAWNLRELTYGSDYYPNGTTLAGRPDLHWKDIRSTGTPLSWQDIWRPQPVYSFDGNIIAYAGRTNDMFGTFDLGFDFPYYGEKFANTRINNAGWMSFTAANRSVLIGPTPMPDPGVMDNVIAFAWALYSDGRADANGVQEKTFSNQQTAHVHRPDPHSWVFSYHRWPAWFVRTPDEFLTGQIELRADGSIFLRYQNYEATPGNEPIFGGPTYFIGGMQDGTATRGQTPVWKELRDLPTPGAVVHMRPVIGAHWLATDLQGGVIPALGGTTTLNVTLDAGALPAGTFTTSIVVDSNDSAGHSEFSIPVTFTVANSATGIRLLTPPAKTTVATGGTLALSAEVDGDTSGLTSVEFLRDGTVIGVAALSGNTANFSWTNVPAGRHEITARVTRGTHRYETPVAVVQAGGLLSVRIEGTESGMFPTVVSNNRAFVERMDAAPIALNAANFSTWGSATDIGEVTASGNGTEIRLRNQSVKRVPLARTITPNTILEFDYRNYNAFGSPNNQVHGIGLVASTSLTPPRIFQIAGLRTNWGSILDFNNYPLKPYGPGAQSEWRRFRIPVGQFYTGAATHLAFVQMNNETQYLYDLDGAYRNIRIYEAESAAPVTYTWSFSDSPLTVTGDAATRAYFAPGPKTITVTATDGTHTATANRTVEVLGAERFAARINFQPPNQVPASNYLTDDGAVFAARGNDLSYGWNTNRSQATSRDGRVFGGNVQSDTNIAMGTAHVWEIAVPNGLYSVQTKVGSSLVPSNNLLRAEGVVLMDRNLNATDYATSSATVPVADGRLTLTSERNTASVCYIEIVRVDDTQRPPVPGFIVSSQTSDAPFVVTFNAASSFDNDGEILSYQWDFGDGFTGAGVAPSHTYLQTGSFPVTLTVTDNSGLSASQTRTLAVTGTNQPSVLVTPPAAPRAVIEGGPAIAGSTRLNAPPAAPVTVTFSSAARAVATPSSLVFTPENWATPQMVLISAINNEIVDGNGTATFTTVSASADPAYQGLIAPPFSVTVADNDAHGTIQLASASRLLYENAGPATFEVTRTGGSTGALTVAYQTGSGTAQAGQDFVTTSGTLHWAHLEGGSKTITVPLVDNTTPEGPETFTVTLTSATADGSGVNVLGTPTSATATILDDDNTAPAVILESPAPGLAVQVGDTIALRATVTSATATITSVAFRINGQIVSTQTAPLTGQLFGFDAVVPVGATGWDVVAIDSNSGSTTSETRALATAAIPPGTGTGFLREVFNDITGTNVSDLTGASKFPDQPDSFAFVTTGTLSHTSNATNYGTRHRAYFLAPKTGTYHFSVAANNRAELWLGTTDQSASRVRIIQTTNDVDPDQWTGNAQQRSAAIPLVAGQRYYLEALQKAGTSGTRHIQVGVELPGGQLELPIPVHRLAPFNGVKPVFNKDVVSVREGGFGSFTVRLSDQPVTTTSVAVERVSGDEDIQVTGGHLLVFTPENWDTPRTVTLTAAADADAVESEAVIRLTFDNGEFRDITAREFDTGLNHTPEIVLESPSGGIANIAANHGLLLRADVSDPDNDPLTIAWTQVSGPGTATFENPAAAETGARFSTNNGTYQLRLTVGDGGFTVIRDITVAVAPVGVQQANITTTRTGDLTLNGQTWTVTGAGNRFNGTADSGRIAYVEMTGDFVVHATLNSLTGPEYSSAYLMVRESLAPGSRLVGVGANRAGGIFYGEVIRRESSDATLIRANTSVHTGQFRITRTGDSFQLSRRDSDGFWYHNTHTIAMGAKVIVGLAVDNFQNSSTSLATANWTNVDLPQTVPMAPTVVPGSASAAQTGQAVQLAGLVTDDGVPAGSTLDSIWIQTSGPGTASFADAYQPDTPVTFDLAGTYTLRLLAFDGDVITYNDLTFSVTDHALPVIQLTSPSTTELFLLPGVGLLIEGTATPAGSVAVQWSVQSAPNGIGVTFDPPNAVATAIQFGGAGTFGLRVTATNGGTSVHRDLTVQIGDHQQGLPDPATPALWYPLNGSATNSVGTTNNGTTTGAVQWQAGQRGQSVRLDLSGGSTAYEYVQTGAGITPSASTGFSATLWFRLESLPGDTGATGRTLIQQTDSGGSGRTWLYTIRSGTDTRLTSFLGGLQTIAPSGNIALNTWHHAAITVLGSDMRMYLDGQLVAQAVRTFEANAGALRLGNHKVPTTAQQHVGNIDDFAYFSRQLSAAEISAMVSTGPANIAPLITLASTATGDAGVPVPLSAQVTDDGKPLLSSLTSTWSAVTPGSDATFDNITSASTQATITTPGTNRLRLRASDGQVAVFRDIVVTITAPSNDFQTRYAAWAQNANLPAGQDGLLDAPRGDGVSNLVRFALALPADAPLSQVHSALEQAADSLTFTYTRRAGIPDLHVRAETSTTLATGSWSTAPLQEQVLSTADGVETIKVTLPNATGTRHFLRLSITTGEP